MCLWVLHQWSNSDSYWPKLTSPRSGRLQNIYDSRQLSQFSPPTGAFLLFSLHKLTNFCAALWKGKSIWHGKLSVFASPSPFYKVNIVRVAHFHVYPSRRRAFWQLAFCFKVQKMFALYYLPLRGLLRSITSWRASLTENSSLWLTDGHWGWPSKLFQVLAWQAALTCCKDVLQESSKGPPSPIWLPLCTMVNIRGSAPCRCVPSHFPIPQVEFCRGTRNRTSCGTIIVGWIAREIWTAVYGASYMKQLIGEAFGGVRQLITQKDWVVFPVFV